MAVILRRPLLIGALSLTTLAGLLNSWHTGTAELGGWLVLGTIALSAGLLRFRQQAKPVQQFQPSLASPDRATVTAALAEVATLISQVQNEAGNQSGHFNSIQNMTASALQAQVDQLRTDLDRSELRLAIIGEKAVGKTRLLQCLTASWLPQHPELDLQEIPVSFVPEAANPVTDPPSLTAVLGSDLVILVTAGDLTDPEFRVAHQMVDRQQRLVLVLNKLDQFLPLEQPVILQQLQQRMQGILPSEDIVAIAAAPQPLKVRRYQSGQAVQEWMESLEPETSQLTQRLDEIITAEAAQLRLATAWREAIALKHQAQGLLNQVRRDRALPLIEQFQWLAAVAAFANPVPTLDLLATAAINTQLILDLGAVYQQKFSLSQAQQLAKTLAQTMLKLGVVELSTQTISAVLKSSTLTYVAGGAVQGVSAAYLTRIAGLSLVEYFQERAVAVPASSTPSWSLESLSETLQTVFQRNQQAAFLQTFVRQVLARLRPSAPQQVQSVLSSEAANH